MFRKIKRWLAENRNWRVNHDANWNGFIEYNENGLSKLQDLLLAELKLIFPKIDLDLVKCSEPYFEGTLPGTKIKIWIYNDGACSTGAVLNFRSEHWDHISPSDFTAEFSKWLRKHSHA